MCCVLNMFSVFLCLFRACSRAGQCLVVCLTHRMRNKHPANRDVDVRRFRLGVVHLGAHRQDRGGPVLVRHALPRNDHHGRAGQEGQEQARDRGSQGERMLKTTCVVPMRQVGLNTIVHTLAHPYLHSHSLALQLRTVFKELSATSTFFIHKGVSGGHRPGIPRLENVVRFPLVPPPSRDCCLAFVTSLKLRHTHTHYASDRCGFQIPVTVLRPCSQEDKITMLYEVRDGPCLESFGIHVANMAGFPRHAQTSVPDTYPHRSFVTTP